MSESSDLGSPTKQDLALAIAVLKAQGLAGVNSAVLHGTGPEGKRLLEAGESLARVVMLLRDLRSAEELAERIQDTSLIVHRCPNCQREFDSPSVCADDGGQTESFVRPIKLAIWKELPPGNPQGLGMADLDVDATIAIDFEKGSATVFPIQKHYPGGGYSSSGPYRTPGLTLEVTVENWSLRRQHGTDKVIEPAEREPDELAGRRRRGKRS
jgi:hypothetical protein